MGDLPEAGKYWYLTERSGSEVDAAVAALHAKYGAGSRGLASSLPVRADVGDFPPSVVSRLRPILRDHRYLKHAWRTRGKPRAASQPTNEGFWAKVRLALGIAALVAVTVGIWLVGLGALLWFALR